MVKSSKKTKVKKASSKRKTSKKTSSTRKKTIKRTTKKKSTVTRIKLPDIKLETKLSPLALGYSLAILNAAYVLIISLLAKAGYALKTLEIIQRFIFSHSLSIMGIIAGMAEIALYSIIGGVVLVWLYNKFS